MQPDRPPQASGPTWQLEATYTRQLPELFYEHTSAAKFPAPKTVIFNAAVADSLGLHVDDPGSGAAARLLCGQDIPPGCKPFAQAYAGHQFGGFTMLGDGRALVLGEVVDPRGKRFDLQLKGSGRTRYSRGGDGLAALGPMLREYVMSEALAALGVPTTRSLAVVATGAAVYRDRPLPGAVLCRVAASHLRVGTFQYAIASGDTANVQALLDYAIKRHAPELADAASPPLEFLGKVVSKQANLVADWMAIGFIHGVMNTDNVSIAGETIDYGPCAMMEAYDPATVFSSIDSQGRYAYANQPEIMLWNLCRLAETLLPLIDDDAERAIEKTTERLQAFEPEYEAAWRTRMRRKLGLEATTGQPDQWIDEMLGWLQSQRRDWTNFFRDLSDDAVDSGDPLLGTSWYSAWQQALATQPGGPSTARDRMRATNPSVIPRNTIVESVLDAANDGDLGPLETLLQVLSDPWTARPRSDPYRQPRPANAPAYQTFCGT
ncbi:MAG: YdiU family protein [Planctomycetota bacterium]